jgi:hypothetical protein
LPSVVSASKSGAMSPIANVMINLYSNSYRLGL